MKPGSTPVSLWLLSLGLAGAGAAEPPSTSPSPAPPPPQESPAQRDIRMAWWREARFGLFIHWGAYARLGGEWNGKRIDSGVGHGIGEWIMYNAKIPVADYAREAAQFNPVEFDAGAWVRLAKEAGQKYLVITTKHHDGFAMFHSKASAFNIADHTPFKRDPMAELAAACRNQGVRLGFYYSQAQDWHHAGGAAYKTTFNGGDPGAGRWDPAQQGDMDAYLEKVAAAQVRELLTNYGPVSVFWWDTPVGMTGVRAAKLAALLPLQPGIITNNRLNDRELGSFLGDTETPEQTIPPTGFKDRDFEVCMTMNDTWGFKRHDQNWKPASELIRKLVDVASKGGNFLLNVGPDELGRIPQPSVDRLQAVGRWLRIHGEAIYGTQASPFAKLPWGRCTRKPGILYFHIFDWPKDGRLLVPGLKSTPRAARLLAGGQVLRVISQGRDTVLELPGNPPDSSASVIRAEFAAEPEIDNRLPGARPDGSIDLPLWMADIHNPGYGAEARLGEDAGGPAIVDWTGPKTHLAWSFETAAPRTYDVVARLASAKPGAQLRLQIGKESVTATLQGDSSPTVLGRLSIATPGVHELNLRPVPATWQPVVVRSIELRPAAPSNPGNGAAMTRLLNLPAVLLCAVSSAPHAAQPAQPPNVVFILADDQRADELGCAGHPLMKTPNIDRLAREGVMFQNSFVSSASCLPNRTSLLTGQWERRHTIGWNSRSALSPQQWADTLPMVLKGHGYTTAYLGKNHTPGLRYWDFDCYYANRQGHLGFYPKAAQPIFNNASADTQPEILGEGAGNFLETDPRFVERAGEQAGVFLRERAKDKPFFLYVCFNVPHSAGTRSMKQLPSDDDLYRNAYRDVEARMPLPPGYLAEADVKEPKLPLNIYSGKQISSYDYRRTPEALREHRVRVCQTVSGIDRVVGQIMGQLERLGLAGNTIFVYSADNGILHGEHGYGGKCLLYDPSIRVPLLIRDPRQPAEQRGRRIEELAVSQDVAPTILDLCGIPAPAGMQGRSLLPLLRGEPVQWRRDFFCESLILLQDYPLIQGVRSADWKYVRYWPNRPAPQDYREVLNLGLHGDAPAYEELFHLAADPLEQSNLAADPQHASQLEAMRVRCGELLRQTRGDPQMLPAVSFDEWMSETPAAWKNVLPLLSRKLPSRANR